MSTISYVIPVYLSLKYLFTAAITSFKAVLDMLFL
nr:MAG TPA: hypothetical protein [Caudoviricetes sp.]